MVTVLDKFLSQQTCDKCHGSLREGRVVSRLKHECICMKCSLEETNDPKYKTEIEAINAEIKSNGFYFATVRF